MPNGVRVLVQEFAGSEVVALQLWVRAGGRDEAQAELGLAHYLEHMLFKGTVMRAAGFVEREVEGVGGGINAGTSLDYTYFHAVLPAARALTGIEMLADISVNSTLNPTALDLEKNVVLEEMRLSQDSPRRLMFRQLYEVVFDGHPYGRPVIGTPEIVRGLTRETLMSFYRRHYVPESFVLVVVGPVKTAEVLAAAERTLGRLPRSGQERLPIAPPTGFGPKRLDIERAGAQAYLGFAWLGPKLDHADTPAVDLLVSILGQSRSSRLTQSLRERLALVSTIDAGYSALEAAGAISVIAQLDPANLPRAEAEVLNEIRRVRDRGVSDAELRRAVTAAEARHAFALETAEARARAFGRAETVWRLEEELAYVDRLRSVTPEQIRSAARRYLDLERYSRLAFVPPAK
ncbi:MAG: M16 family metallopeptidase [Candidatus Rokuibacteriota bacterium]